MFIFDLIKSRGNLPLTSGLHAFVYWFTQIIIFVFLVMYFHQMIFIVFGTFFHYKVKNKNFKYHDIGIVISARNESKVIGNLINSIKANDYPKDKLKIFVVADNCTDDTAQICRDLGCIVFERFNTELVGKGYALNYLFTKLHTEEEYADLVPEAYIVIDADNVLKPNFITEMNKTYDAGFEMVTSYRNTKNFGKNWLTSGYGYWFLHEARHLNNCRMTLGSCCAISGTGFLISSKVVKEFDNWHFFTLTEDIQCSTEYALTKRRVAYCSTAELYDEQPETFKQAWRQRERWAKGFYQVFGKYGGNLFTSIFKSFSCWDIFTTLAPALVLSVLIFVTLPTTAIIAAVIGQKATALYALQSLGISIVYIYIQMFVIALLVAITEWKRIVCPWYKKILYLFTFPFFMMTYFPIAISAIFKKVTWKPIVHTANISIDQLDNNKEQK